MQFAAQTDDHSSTVMALKLQLQRWIAFLRVSRQSDGLIELLFLREDATQQAKHKS